MIITESAVFPRYFTPQTMHLPLQDDAGRLLKKAVETVKVRSKAENLKINITHAILCSGDDAKKSVIDHCSVNLREDLAKYATPEKTPVILAMGAAAVKALGIKMKSLKDMQSRILPAAVELNGLKYTVIVTLSAKQLSSMSGVYHIFFNDLTRAVEIAKNGYAAQRSIVELTKDYRYPRTIEEVEALCLEIENYYEGNETPGNWLIAIDSETNTLFPHLKKLKVLGVSIAWATGKSCYIALWHKECPYDPEKAIPFIARLFASAKPKTMHNGKYDIKVFKKIGIEVVNYAWDSMTGEHLRYEDKGGNYGLKFITRIRYPEFAAYADELHAMQAEAEGGDSQLDTIRSREPKAGKAETEEAVPEAIVDNANWAAEFGIEAAAEEPLTKAGKPRKKKPKKAKVPKEKKAKKKGLEGKGFEDVPLATLEVYAAIDTDMTRRISLGQLSMMKTEQTYYTALRAAAAKLPRHYPMPTYSPSPAPLRDLMKDYVLPTTRVLAKMELGGIKINRDKLQAMKSMLDDRVKETMVSLRSMAEKPELNIDSKKELVAVLFEDGYIHPETGKRIIHSKAGIPLTATGQLKTGEKQMNWLIANNGCPFSTQKVIVSKAKKAKDTFLQNVWDLSAADGFIHSSFQQHGTGTGRLSCVDENLQNIPKKLAGVIIKEIFECDDDSYVFVNADAKNAEVRILTAYSKDAQLIKSVNDGLDTHCFIGAKIVAAIRAEGAQIAKKKLADMGLDDHYPLDYADFKSREQWEVTDKKRFEMLDKFRTAVKRVVFGILYGAGAHKIAETIGISKGQAQALIDLLFQLFPAIRIYIDATKQHMREFGCVETFFGRRRRYAIAGASNSMRSRAERQAVNFLIQSTSSDIVLGCLADIDQPLERDFGGRNLLTVHDSIGLQFPKKYLDQLPDFLTHHLQKVPAKKYPWLPVEFKWDFSVGDNYGVQMSLAAYKEKLTIKEKQNAPDEAYGEADVRRILSDVTDTQ